MYEDDEPASGASKIRTLALWILLVVAMIAVVVLLMRFLASPPGKQAGVHQIALIKQPPPPPPPKPPEKPPEPPKVPLPPVATGSHHAWW